MGITREGQIYAVGVDGNLYKIDKSNANETIVGPTGLSLITSSNQYYSQSGEIDPKTNTFYWFAIDNTGNGGLYEINLSNGHATLIGTADAQVLGMVIPTDETAADAPDKVKDANINITAPSLDGTLTFTAPDSTYFGTPLTGELVYKLYDDTYSETDDSVVASGTVTPGEKVSVPVHFNNSGVHNLALTVANNAGISPRQNFNVFVGFDNPNSVTGLNLTQDAADNHKVTITWTKPEGGARGGIIDAQNLTFDVFRHANGKSIKIATNLTDNSVVDQIPEASIAYYTYGVVAKTDTLVSDTVWSDNGILVGNPIDVDANNPWYVSFTDPSTFPLFTVIDANNDGETWEGSFDTAYGPMGDNGNDDWLITPPLRLKNDHLYYVSFEVARRGNNYTNSIEVKMGNTATVDGMKTQIMGTSIPDWSGNDPGYSNYKNEIYPDSTGIYYIGFHENTPDDQFLMVIYNITVEEGPSVFAPDSVDNLTITPHADGALAADVTFNVAKTRINGQSYNKVDSLQLFRDGVQIATINDKNSGEKVTYSDNDVNINNGYHTYQVIPWLNGEEGRKASAKRFIGTDSPINPKDVKLINNTNNITAQWAEFPDTGINNGYVNPQKVSVTIYGANENSGGYSVGDSITTSSEGATSVILSQDPEVCVSDPSSTEQEMYRIYANANYNGAHSGDVLAATVIGPTVQGAYNESFKGGAINNLIWIERNQQTTDNTDAIWRINNDDSQDGDAGSVIWHPYVVDAGWATYTYNIVAGDQTSINTPKISLRGTSNPKLYFYMKGINNDPATLDVVIYRQNGTEDIAASYDLNNNTETGWQLKSIDLSKYTSDNFIIIKFRGTATGDSPIISLDNIKVFDQLAYNLSAIDFKAPKSVQAGKSMNIKATIQNFGSNAASGYDVILFVNSQPADTVTATKTLQTLDIDTLSFNYPIAINNNDDTVRVSAQINYLYDLDEDDNATATKAVIIKPSDYVKVNDLNATEGEQGTVKLNWTKPEKVTSESVTENFETYEPFATDLGDWTLVDGDKGEAGSMFNTATYPGQGTAFAFDAFNPNAITETFNVVQNNPGLAPHDGDQFAGAPYAYNPAEYRYVNTDDWLISPELPGTAQTISFYAMNVATTSTTYKENFDVLYSTESTDTADFKLLGSYVADGTTPMTEGANWKQFTTEIPEGAKYFAIHHNTDRDNSFLLGIDDINYIKLAAGANDSIIGYNVYRDGELVGSVKGDILTYNDKAEDGDHIYNITVLYQSKNGEINESAFSNSASINVNGIESVAVNSEGSYDVYTIDGKVVMKNSKSLKGLTQGIYIINDKKYIIK